MLDDAADESGKLSLVTKHAFLNDFEDFLQPWMDFVFAIEVGVTEIFDILS